MWLFTYVSVDVCLRAVLKEHSVHADHCNFFLGAGIHKRLKIAVARELLTEGPLTEWAPKGCRRTWGTNV